MWIKAAVLRKSDGLLTKRTLSIEDVTLDGPQADEVVVRITSCGVCGTDRGCLHGMEPMTLDGKPLAARFFQQSSWATHTVALERQAVKVPDDIDADLMGPLGCSLSTGAGAVLNELKPRPGTSIAVFGAGSVGLAAVMAARLTGATTIIAIDTVASRLALARELGATHTIERGPTTVAEIKDLVDDTLDYSIECTDGSNLVAEAIEALGILGTCAMVGGAAPSDDVKVKHEGMLLSGKTLTGVAGGGGSTPDFHLALMRLQAEGRFPLDRLIRRYPFAAINEAIDDSDAGAVVKPVLMMAAP